jgi:hypothetical protein
MQSPWTVANRSVAPCLATGQTGGTFLTNSSDLCCRNYCQKPPESTDPPPHDSSKKQDNSGDEKKKEEKNFFQKYGVWLGLGSLSLSFITTGGYLYLYVWGMYLSFDFLLFSNCGLHIQAHPLKTLMEMR